MMSALSSTSWQGVGHTDIGRVRSLNQDAFVLDQDAHLWVVADGMGGHAGGEVASRIAIESIPTIFRECLSSLPEENSPPKRTAQALERAIHHTNQAIRAEAEDKADLKGMGTTVVALAITEDTEGCLAIIGHAGDSRAYVFREGSLHLLTQDHTLLEERLALNLITRDQIRTHPLRHILTKGLGIDSEVHPTIQEYPLTSQDLLVLCSDGLTKMLEDTEIQNMMVKEHRHPSQLPQKLIDTANRLGGEDNTTVVIIGKGLSPMERHATH